MQACEYKQNIKRYQSLKLEKNAVIIDRLSELVALHIRYGYKRLHILLLREGFQINHKKTYRLYIQTGCAFVNVRKSVLPKKEVSQILLECLSSMVVRLCI